MPSSCGFAICQTPAITPLSRCTGRHLKSWLLNSVLFADVRSNMSRLDRSADAFFVVTAGYHHATSSTCSIPSLASVFLQPERGFVSSTSYRPVPNQRKRAACGGWFFGVTRHSVSVAARDRYRYRAVTIENMESPFTRPEMVPRSLMVTFR